MQTLEQMQAHDTAPIQKPNVPPKFLMAVGNVFVRLLLRSPLHAWLSNTLLLLTYTGRKSGTRYTIPVSYTRDGDTVTIFTNSSRLWWKQLRAGVPVVVECKRRRFTRAAEVIGDDQAAVAAGLLAQIRAHPALAKGYRVSLDTAGQPDADAARQAARFVVMVRIHLRQACGRSLPA